MPSRAVLLAALAAVVLGAVLAGQAPDRARAAPRPPAGAEAGVLGALAGIMGSLMAMEVIREIVDFGDGLVGRLLMVDARGMRFDVMRYRWDPANPLSGR